ncbi:MAG: creatininase family protein, partial [Clostridia bacterium]|nr:creatininase family protein [Clostridia bacterium]
MLWENLTVDEFAAAEKETKGVVLVPIGCLEKHGNHMPLGTDILIAREISIKSAEREPAMVFPYLPFGIVAEVKHKLGTISLTSNLI